MKKSILSVIVMLSSVLCTHAGEGDEYLHLSGGFLFQNTMSVTAGWEKELAYDNAIELFAEAGDRWTKDPECGKVCSKSFWKHYYWNGGFLYKKSVKKWRNSSLRLYLGPVSGATRGKYFFGAEGGFEYNHTFSSGVKFVVRQKNDVCFFHGDSFRNGLTVGIKVPL